MKTITYLTVRRTFFFALGVILILAIPSCTLSFSDGGAISLTIAENVTNAKNLLPALDMNPASYRVSGIGPLGATFTPVTISGTTASIEKLVAGSWTITVDAYNADATPTKIGSGSAIVTVINGRTTNTPVTVIPLTGNGTLTLSLTWPSDVLVNPQVVATLKPTTGSVQSLAFTVDTTSASYTSSAIPAGYYTLSISLNEETTTVAGRSETVRIVDGQTTNGSYSFPNLNPAGGTVSVDITPELANPFTVSISGGQSTMNVGASQSLTAVVSNASGPVIYAWYVNGIDQDVSTATWTCGSTWKVGYYTIDAVAISTDGRKAGSSSMTVSVEPNVYAGGVSLSSSNHMIPGYWKNKVWNPLPCFTQTTYPNIVKSIFVAGNDVYSCGQNYDTQGFASSGYWKNDDWINLECPANMHATTNVIAYNQGSVFIAGGVSDTNIGLPGIWVNGAWNAVETPQGATSGSIQSIWIVGSDIYACGQVGLDGVDRPGFWKNGVWNELSRVSTKYGIANSICVYGSDVYVGGYSYDENWIEIPGYWKNSIWNQLPQDNAKQGALVWSLTLDGDDVYIGGIVRKIGYMTSGYWKNSIWTELPPLSPQRNAGTVAIVVSEGNIYAGGYCSNLDGSSVGGYWQNGDWIDLKNPASSFPMEVSSMFIQSSP